MDINTINSAVLTITQYYAFNIAPVLFVIFCIVAPFQVLLICISTDKHDRPVFFGTSKRLLLMMLYAFILCILQLSIKDPYPGAYRYLNYVIPCIILYCVMFEIKIIQNLVKKIQE